MRSRLGLLVLGFVLAAGCGKTPDPAAATPEDEKAAEARQQEEAARELKARQDERKQKHNPLDDD